MNPLEIVQRARIHFGEETANTISDTTMKEWVNDAMKELYGALYLYLPPEELKPFIRTDPETITDGYFEVPDLWDQILTVSEDGVNLFEIPPDSIRAIDTHMMFAPTQSVWARRDNSLWVRPDTVTSVDIKRLQPPDPLDITPSTGDFEEGSADIESFTPRWHQGLVWLVTSYAYAQEEDLQQAEHYRGRMMQMLPAPAEA